MAFDKGIFRNCQQVHDEDHITAVAMSLTEEKRSHV
jgi:hypothetical protein